MDTIFFFSFLHADIYIILVSLVITWVINFLPIPHFIRSSFRMHAVRLSVFLCWYNFYVVFSFFIEDVVDDVLLMLDATGDWTPDHLVENALQC